MKIRMVKDLISREYDLNIKKGEEGRIYQINSERNCWIKIQGLNILVPNDYFIEIDS